MPTPKTPKIVKTVKKAFTGRQVPVSGHTIKPDQQQEPAPQGIKAPRQKATKLTKPQDPSALSYK